MNAAGSREALLRQMDATSFDCLKEMTKDFAIIRDRVEQFLDEVGIKGLD
jgi:hypothetical protein